VLRLADFLARRAARATNGNRPYGACRCGAIRWQGRPGGWRHCGACGLPAPMPEGGSAPVVKPVSPRPGGFSQYAADRSGDLSQLPVWWEAGAAPADDSAA
jgi:hypothetical protein